MKVVRVVALHELYRNVLITKTCQKSK